MTMMACGAANIAAGARIRARGRWAGVQRFANNNPRVEHIWPKCVQACPPRVRECLQIRMCAEVGCVLQLCLCDAAAETPICSIERAKFCAAHSPVLADATPPMRTHARARK